MATSLLQDTNNCSHWMCYSQRFNSCLYVSCSEDGASAEARQWEQTAHQTTDECLYGLGQGRAQEDTQGVSRHAQLQHIQDTG